MEDSLLTQFIFEFAILGTLKDGELFMPSESISDEVSVGTLRYLGKVALWAFEHGSFSASVSSWTYGTF
jgi:hypothetical protein